MMLKIILLASLISLPVQGTIEEVKTPEKQILNAEVVKRMETIKYIETKGNCNLKGADGELGCYQIMPSTWKALTKKHLGEVKGYSTTTAEIIVYKELLTLNNLQPQQVFLKWNAGGAKKCSRGITKAGIPFDSCAYVKRSMDYYKTLDFDVVIR